MSGTNISWGIWMMAVHMISLLVAVVVESATGYSL
jgi:hypothetical protein